MARILGLVHNKQQVMARNLETSLHVGRKLKVFNFGGTIKVTKAVDLGIFSVSGCHRITNLELVHTYGSLSFNLDRCVTREANEPPRRRGWNLAEAFLLVLSGDAGVEETEIFFTRADRGIRALTIFDAFAPAFLATLTAADSRRSRNLAITCLVSKGGQEIILRTAERFITETVSRVAVTIENTLGTFNGIASFIISGNANALGDLAETFFLLATRQIGVWAAEVLLAITFVRIALAIHDAYTVFVLASLISAGW